MRAFFVLSDSGSDAGLVDVDVDVFVELEEEDVDVDGGVLVMGKPYPSAKEAG
jgi:hypothetical protein